MIGKVTRGVDVGGLLRYLYGPGRANEHHNPHLVGSWLGDAQAVLDRLEPPPGLGPQRFIPLSDRLQLPLALLPDIPDKHVWQCSMRLADGDRQLTEAEWAQVAREVVQSTGFAPSNDPGGCRWVAVRHSDDHIHVVVILAREDGGRVDTYRDWPKVHSAARAVEKRFSLTTVPSPSRVGTVNPTRAEVEKARRTGRREPARAYLAREVRLASRTSWSLSEFEARLTWRDDIVIAWRSSHQIPGQVTGYRVGRVGDVDASGAQVWFAGSKLSADLSLPKLLSRWDGQPARTQPQSLQLRPHNRSPSGRQATVALVKVAAEGPSEGTTAVENATVAARNLTHIASVRRART